jgi:magnesium transporter
VQAIFRLKRTLVYFHKAMIANRDVLMSLQKEYGKKVRNDVQRRLIHLYYDVAQLLDMIATYRDILTGSLDIYLTAVNNNMNKVMKKMAAYGTIVLVPTFIVGMYGMNFDVMPEIHWKYGYLFALGLILSSVILLVWYFKRNEWF